MKLHLPMHYAFFSLNYYYAIVENGACHVLSEWNYRVFVVVKIKLFWEILSHFSLCGVLFPWISVGTCHIFLIQCVFSLLSAVWFQPNCGSWDLIVVVFHIFFEQSELSIPTRHSQKCCWRQFWICPQMIWPLHFPNVLRMCFMRSLHDKFFCPFQTWHHVYMKFMKLVIPSRFMSWKKKKIRIL